MGRNFSSVAVDYIVIETHTSLYHMRAPIIIETIYVKIYLLYIQTQNNFQPHV